MATVGPRDFVSSVPRPPDFDAFWADVRARAFPERAEQVERTLAPFDPLHFAPRVRAATPISAEPAGSPLGAPKDGTALRPLAAARSGAAEVDETTGSGDRDRRHVARWLAERLAARPIG